MGWFLLIREFPNQNGASLHRAFHVHTLSQYNWNSWKGCKNLTHPCIISLTPSAIIKGKQLLLLVVFAKMEAMLVYL